jgi:hypothetical protein
MARVSLTPSSWALGWLRILRGISAPRVRSVDAASKGLEDFSSPFDPLFTEIAWRYRP